MHKILMQVTEKPEIEGIVEIRDPKYGTFLSNEFKLLFTADSNLKAQGNEYNSYLPEPHLVFAYIRFGQRTQFGSTWSGWTISIKWVVRKECKQTGGGRT